MRVRHKRGEVESSELNMIVEKHKGKKSMLHKDTHGTEKQKAALFFKFPKTYHLNAILLWTLNMP